MTRGTALLAARQLLGPAAIVRYRPELPFPCIVGILATSWQGIAVGRDWDEAIAAVRFHLTSNRES